MLSLRSCCLALLVSISVSGVQAQSNAENAIRALLDTQSHAWNAGDIESFMSKYWQNDDLQFLGSSGLTSGWDGTLARYQKRYPDKQAMGHLKFDLHRINKRSAKVYSVIGQYYLSRDGLDDLSGYFLLIVQKIKGKWLIVADSTH